jgi:hypothetical protein
MAGSGFNPKTLTSGLSGMLSGLFGNSGAPYDAAMNEYEQAQNKASGAQQPFWDAGTNAIPNLNQWLQKISDPSGFVNSLMGSYQQSPMAKYMQQQARRAGNNAASASGLMGSTPFGQQMEQTSADISSQDMQNWLANVFGINTQYGQGLTNEVGIGANAGNALTNMYSNFGNSMGEAAYGSKAGDNQDFTNLLGGGLSLASMFL